MSGLDGCVRGMRRPPEDAGNHVARRISRRMDDGGRASKWEKSLTTSHSMSIGLVILLSMYTFCEGGSILLPTVRLIHLQRNPTAHPLVNDGFRFVHQPKIQQQLRRPTYSRVESREDPRVSITGVLSNEDRLEFGLVVRRKVKLLLSNKGCSPCSCLPFIDLPALTEV